MNKKLLTCVIILLVNIPIISIINAQSTTLNKPNELNEKILTDENEEINYTDLPLIRDINNKLPVTAKDCDCPYSNDDRVPIVLCVLLFILVYVPVPLLCLVKKILDIGYTLFPDAIDWVELWDTIFFNIYIGRWMLPIIVIIIDLGCSPYGPQYTKE